MAEVVETKKGAGAAVTEEQTQNEGTPILFILSVIAIIVAFSESMLIPALPTIQKEFHTTPVLVAWILGIYLLVGAILTPIFGKLGDTYGKKKMLLVCMTFYSI